jgi:hypothetical protein
LTNSVYRRAVELIEADIGDELVALDARAGNCFGFNDVAAAVWRQLKEPRSFDELRDELVDEYDVGREQCTSELKELLNDLVERGLVARDTNQGNAGR